MGLLKRIRRFPCILQYDQMDCGPSSLAAICNFYGKPYSIQELREYCCLSRDGVGLIELEDAVRKVGFQTLAVKTSIKKLCSNRPFPCILHWNNNHYVVLYSVRKSFLTGKNYFYVSDPSFGRIKLSQSQFTSHWCGADGDGIALLMSPTTEFFKKIPKEYNLNLKKNIIAYLRKYRYEYSVLFSGMLFSSLFAMIFPFLTQSLIDMGIKSRNLDIVFIFLLAQLFLFLGDTVISIVRDWTLLYSNSVINIDIISSFLNKLIKLPFKFFETKQLGDFTTRIDDHERIQNFLTSSSITVVFSFFNFFVYLILLASYNKQIMLVYGGITVISLFWSAYYVSKEKRMEYRRLGLQSNTQQYVFEIINGIAEIKLNKTERYQLDCWKDCQFKLLDIDIKIQKLIQLDKIGFAAFNKLKDIIVVFMAVCAVIHGEISLGMLLAISYIVGSLSGPISQVIDFVRSLQYAHLSYERLNEVQMLNNEDTTSFKDISESLKGENKSIVIKNLSFSYGGPRAPKVLDDISLVIPIGKTTAIVGDSGSGKTTLLKILLKYYENYDGTIQVGNSDLKDITVSSLRGHCGVVMQDGYIFSDTLERNIVTGDALTNKKSLNDAVEIAQLKDFINRLPQGMNTKLGAGGNGISGGQKQRIFIARAIYKNPSVIMFDEATSSLDATTEKHIFEGLQKFLHGKTVITIAHRLSTVMNADQIVALQNGKIMECGKHSELILKKGYYYNLVKNQLQLGK